MKKLILCSLILLGMTASSVWANLTFVEDYAEGSSWSPGYWFITDNTADHMQMMVSVSGGLRVPALATYASPGLVGWSETYNDGTISIWDTATANTPSFRVWFEDSLKTQTFTWYLQSYDNGQLNPSDDNYFTFQNRNLSSYGGPPSGWDPGFLDGSPNPNNVIPAPGAILLGSIGIGLVGYLRRRRAL